MYRKSGTKKQPLRGTKLNYASPIARGLIDAVYLPETNNGAYLMKNRTFMPKVGSPTWVGKGGVYSMESLASGAGVQVATPAHLKINFPITIVSYVIAGSAVARAPGGGGFMVNYANPRVQPVSAYGWRWATSSLIGWYYSHQGSGTVQGFAGGGTIPTDGRPHLVALTLTTSSQKAYIDKVVQQSTTATLTTGPQYDASTTLDIGKYSDLSAVGETNFLWGAIWNRELSAAEISYLVDNPYALFVGAKHFSLSGFTVGATNYTTTLTDTSTVTETLARITSRALSETVTVVDSIAKTAIKAFTDAMTVSDSLVRVIATVRSEIVTVTESLSRSISRTLSDAVTMAETVVRVTAKKLSDTVSSSDSITANKVSLVTLSDAITATDSLIRVTSKSLADTVTATDTLVRAIAKALSDSVTPTDSIARQVIRVLTDGATATDTLNKFKISLLTLTDSVTVTESFRKTANKQLNDTANITDFITRSVVKFLVDTATLTDSVQKSIRKVFSDTVTVVDTVAAFIAGALSLGKSVLLKLLYRSNYPLQQSPKSLTVRGKKRTVIIKPK